jgi:hypothetical protein
MAGRKEGKREEGRGKRKTELMLCDAVKLLL